MAFRESICSVNLATRILHHKSGSLRRTAYLNTFGLLAAFLYSAQLHFNSDMKGNDFFKILMGKHMQRANNLWVITERILLTWNWMNKGLVVCAVQRTSS